MNKDLYIYILTTKFKTDLQFCLTGVGLRSSAIDQTLKVQKLPLTTEIVISKSTTFVTRQYVDRNIGKDDHRIIGGELYPTFTGSTDLCYDANLYYACS